MCEYEIDVDATITSVAKTIAQCIDSETVQRIEQLDVYKEGYAEGESYAEAFVKCETRLWLQDIKRKCESALVSGSYENHVRGILRQIEIWDAGLRKDLGITEWKGDTGNE